MNLLHRRVEVKCT